jgi:hypothetical protein
MSGRVLLPVIVRFWHMPFQCIVHSLWGQRVPPAGAISTPEIDEEDVRAADSLIP